jgi:SsrA-binding protein
MSKKESIYEKNVGSLIANNSRAHFEYFIDDIYEAGIVLKGTEVKSLRKSKPSLVESHASCDVGEVFLYNFHINEYEHGNRNNHYPKRPKKLLLHKNEIKKLIGVVQRKGMTLIPLKMYFNQRNVVKVLIGIAKGKKLHDKRQTIKDRDLKREQARGLRD